VRLDVADNSKPATAGSMLQATSDVAAANPDLAVKVLDHSALKVSLSNNAGLRLQVVSHAAMGSF
jgi:hypothetical protein